MPRKTKPTRPVNPVEEALMNIYKDTNGSVPDLSRFERRRRRIVHPFLWGVIVLFLLITVASGVSFYYFAPMMQVTQERTVRLLIEGPEDVVSGAKATYVITYVNEERVALKDVELRLNPSTGFTIEQATPKASKNNTVWTIGKIESGGHGSVQLIGTAVGTTTVGVTLGAVLTYTRDNFSSGLVEQASIETMMKSAPLTVKLDGPDQLVIGEATQYTANVENNGDTPLTNVVVLARLPIGAAAKDLPKNAREEKVVSTDGGTSTQSVLRFPVGAVGPGDSVAVPFQFVLSSATAGAKGTDVVPVSVALQTDAGFLVHDDVFVQASTSTTIAVVVGGMNIRMVVNGIADVGTVGWDDTLTATVSYENRGKVAAENVEIRTMVSGLAVDWATFSDTKKGVVKNGEIRWTKRELPALALVKAGASGTITFSLRIRSPQDEALKGEAKDAHIRFEGAMLIGKLGKTTKDSVVTMVPVDVVLNSDLSFRAEMRYFSSENIPYGTGPIPPRVGEPTTYRVFMKVKNHLHEIRSLETRAVLPMFVEWTGKTVVNAGEVIYDPLTREVRWTLNRMPTSVESIETQFEIRFTPLPEHAKAAISLIAALSLDAEDGVTQGKIHRTQGPFTTALPDDPEAKGKGVVVE